MSCFPSSPSRRLPAFATSTLLPSTATSYCPSPPKPFCSLLPPSHEHTSKNPDPNWRAFRAHLVQTQSSPASAPASTSSQQSWAHPVSFIEPGSLLLASPEHFSSHHPKTFFTHTAILVLQHSPEGSVGLVLNRPISLTPPTPSSTTSTTPPPRFQIPRSLHNPPFPPHPPHSPHPDNPHSPLSRDIRLSVLEELPCFLGGPVALDTLLVLHSDPSVGTPLTDTLRTAPLDHAIRLYKEGRLPSMRLMLGYTSWSPGQLEHELANNVWYSVSCSDSLLHRHWPAGTLLHRTLLPLMGPHYARIAHTLRHNGHS